MPPRKKNNTGGTAPAPAATPDYNKDGVITSVDEEWAKVDGSRLDKQGRLVKGKKDGVVTKAEKKAYTTPTPVTYQTVTKGGKTTQTQKGGKIRDLPSETTAAEYGINQAVMDKYPDLKDAIDKAIAGNWQPDQFVSYVKGNTDWGKIRSDSEIEFDIKEIGLQANTLQQQIQSKFDTYKAKAKSLGLDLTDEQINSFARESLRSQKSDQAILNDMAAGFVTPGEGASATGQAGIILDDLQNMARSYGITLTAQDLQNRTRQALSQEDWQSYIDGQRDLFREQAKTMYPTAANLLDNYTLEQVLDPYMSDAQQVLGINKTNMSITDPKWTAALNGGDRPMTRDEWIRTMKTDKQFGYEYTNNARNEASSLADNLIAAFGRA